MTVEQLARAAEVARASFEEAQRKAAAARAAEDQRRGQRLEQHDRNRLAAYDDAALEADVLAARQRLHEAILGDPVYAAMIDLLTAQTRRALRHSEANGDASRLGVEPPLNYTPPGGREPDWQMVMSVVVDEASRRAHAEDAERGAAREAAGQGR